MSFDTSAARLRSAVERGRKRVLGQQALCEGLLAAGIAMGGLVVLLTAGTRWFPVPLSILIGLAGLLTGVVRWRRSRPSGYSVAQRIDRAWVTNDQLATAYYFLDQGERAGWVREQRARAERLADRGDIAAALPYDIPGSAWALGVVALLATLMLLIRSGSQETFSLTEPLPALVAGALLPSNADQETQPPEGAAVSPEDEAAAVSLESDEEAEKLALEGAPELNQGAEADGPGDEIAEDMGAPEVEGLSFDEAGGDETAPTEPSADGKQGEDFDSRAEAGEGPGEETNQEADSLLDRLQDAFRNMLSSMNVEPPQLGPSSDQGSQQQARATAAGEGREVPGAESPSEGAEASGEQASSKEIGEQFSVEEGSAEGEQQQGESSVATAGAGEGSKELAEAKQNEAMGELTALFQQRAEEVQGEFTIETGSARQAARTPYSPGESGHRDPGAVLSRDEISIAYRSYVQRYFQTIRQKAAQ